MFEKINATIDELREEIVGNAQDLVRFPSTSGKEKEAQEYVRDTFVKLNSDSIDLWEPDYEELSHHKAFVSGRKDFKGSPNLAATWKGSGGGRSLLLCSHIDIVPEGEHTEWTYPPFGGILTDNTIYGRGVSDMKGTMAAMFAAVRAIGLLGLDLKGDLTILSTIEEETGSAGALSAVLRGYTADAAIIPEPTAFKICPAQQGGARFKITIKGKSAHAGQRHSGVSAIEKADLIRRGIVKYENYLNEKYMSPLYENTEVPFTINIGIFQSGDWFCTVPEKAYLEGRMAIPPGMNVVEAVENLRAFINEEIKDDPWLSLNKPDVDRFDTYWEPAQIEANHPITRSAARAYLNEYKQPAIIAGTPWGTDGRMFTEFAKTPSLIFGPGSSAHCPDEFMKVEDLMKYTRILTNIIIDWCGIK